MIHKPSETMFRCWHAANKSRTLCQIDWLLMGKTKGFEEIPLIEGSLGHVKHGSHTWGSQIHPSYMHFVQKGWWFTKAQFIADAGQLTLEWKNPLWVCVSWFHTQRLWPSSGNGAYFHWQPVFLSVAFESRHIAPFPLGKGGNTHRLRR